MKKIPRFKRYCCDKQGNLYSMNYKRTGSTVKLRPAKGKDGYLQTMLLSDSGKYETHKVHYFVTLAYFGKREKGLEVNHKDGNKENNSIENLEYCTHQENVRHSFANGLEVGLSGSKNPNSKLTESQVAEIRKTVADIGLKYYGRKKIAERFGVSECTIKEIVNRRRNIWKSV